jgi:hypothetical protein
MKRQSNAFIYFFQKKVKETDEQNSLSKCDSDQDQPSKEVRTCGNKVELFFEII